MCCSFFLLLCRSPAHWAGEQQGAFTQEDVLQPGSQELLTLPASVSPTVTGTIKSFCDNCWQQCEDGDQQPACSSSEAGGDLEGGTVDGDSVTPSLVREGSW